MLVTREETKKIKPLPFPSSHFEIRYIKTLKKVKRVLKIRKLIF